MAKTSPDKVIPQSVSGKEGLIVLLLTAAAYASSLFFEIGYLSGVDVGYQYAETSIISATLALLYIVAFVVTFSLGVEIYKFLHAKLTFVTDSVHRAVIAGFLAPMILAVTTLLSVGKFESWVFLLLITAGTSLLAVSVYKTSEVSVSHKFKSYAAESTLIILVFGVVTLPPLFGYVLSRTEGSGHAFLTKGERQEIVLRYYKDKVITREADDKFNEKQTHAYHVRYLDDGWELTAYR